jgi:hypothetical protein
LSGPILARIARVPTVCKVRALFQSIDHAIIAVSSDCFSTFKNFSLMSLSDIHRTHLASSVCAFPTYQKSKTKNQKPKTITKNQKPKTKNVLLQPPANFPLQISTMIRVLKFQKLSSCQVPSPSIVSYHALALAAGE